MARICYVEIPAPDLERAGAFYREVFGWSIEPSDLTDQGYWMFSTGPGQLLGALDPSKPVGTGGPVLYVEVEDLEATIAAARAHGGAVVAAPKAIGADYGYAAILTDPNGCRIGLWSRTG